MAIKNSKQDWTPGALVKIGFMALEVVECIPTPGDFLPDDYRLWNPKNGKQYTFTPHNGLSAGWFDQFGQQILHAGAF